MRIRAGDRHGSARDPSLRLKNGSVQDDSSGMSTSNRISTLADTTTTEPLSGLPARETFLAEVWSN